MHDLYYGPPEDIRAQDVALALMALAIGERVDVGLSSDKPSLHADPNSSIDNDCAGASDVATGEGVSTNKTNRIIAAPDKSNKRAAQESYHLAKAALNEVSVHGEPDQTVVHCLVRPIIIVHMIVPL